MSLFHDAYTKWSSGDLDGSTREMVRIAAAHPDWRELLRMCDRDPPGFVDMMVTIDPVTDDWIVDLRNPNEIARLEEEHRIWNRTNPQNP